MNSSPTAALANAPARDASAMLTQTIAEWDESGDLWIFGYASLVWRPEFEFSEQRSARIHGYHRALKMWSRVNRGSYDCPGLVFALLPGGSCQGVAYRVPQAQGVQTLTTLWQREMPNGVYDPKWLTCSTRQGKQNALAFTLCRNSPNYTGELSDAQYRNIFSLACGRYGSTLDYATRTYEGLLQAGIRDHSLQRVLERASP